MKTILVTTYSPRIHGSYGIVSKEIFQRVFDSKKYRIIHHGWFDIEHACQVPWQVIPTQMKPNPNGGPPVMDEKDIHGQESFKHVMSKVKPDIVWALGDFYMLKHVFEEKKNYPNVQFICHLAVDGEPWSHMQTSSVMNADHVVGLSKFGSDIIGSLLNRPVDYIWHGVNTDIHKQYPEDIKHRLRMQSTNGKFDKDAFVAGWVGKNQYRKQNDQLFIYAHYMVHGDYITCQTCSRVTIKEWDITKGCSKDINKLTMYEPGYDYSYCSHCLSKDIVHGKPNPKFYLYTHMPFIPTDPWNPNALLHFYKVQGHVISTKDISINKGLDEKSMPNVYNMFDIMFYPTGGEGFGIPILEAAACGVPTLYSNYSAHAEVCKDIGIPLKVTYVTEMASQYLRSRVDMNHAIQKTNEIIKDRSILNPLIDKGLERARENTWEIIGQKWLKYIDDVASKCNNAMGVIV